MNKRIFWFLGSLAVFIASLTLLVTGSSLLDKSMSQTHNIPWGNLTTWLGMIALPLSVYWGSNKLRRPDTGFRKYLFLLLKGLIILGILWVPISYLLAGNVAFNFSSTEGFQGGQSAMRWFWRLSYGIPIASLIVVFAHWISVLTQKLGRNS